MRRRVVMEDLGNMNPGELEPRPWNGGDTDFTNDTTVGSLPEKECMKARMAAFQAIMEEVVDNAVDEAPADATPAEVASDVYQTTDEITDKAVALHLVPAGMHGLVRKLVAYKLRPRNSRAKLYARAAHLCAEAVTTDSNDPAYNAGTPAIDTPLEESPSADDLVSTATSAEDESPADGTSPTTAWWNMEGDPSTQLDHEAADPAYNAGTPAIDTPLEESPSADDLVSTATSAEDESPADGTSPTTAWWNMEEDPSTQLDHEAADPAYNAGTPAIDTPLEESPSADDLVSTATSAEDESPADGTSPTTAWWNMEGDTPVETPADDSATPAEGDPENPSDTPTESSDAVTPSDVVVDEGVDQDTASEMKYLITTACHHRRATSKVSRRFSGKIVNQMLHELRYKLPDSFLRKYGID